MSEVLPKVFADLWTRHLPPKKITVRFWRFLKHILLSSLLNPSGNFAPVLMASSLLPRPVHGAVYKWTPNKHFLRLQESLQKKTIKKTNLLWKKIISTIHFQLHHAPLVFTCFTLPILGAFRSGRSRFASLAKAIESRSQMIQIQVSWSMYQYVFLKMPKKTSKNLQK